MSFQVKGLKERTDQPKHEMTFISLTTNSNVTMSTIPCPLSLSAVAMVFLKISVTVNAWRVKKKKKKRKEKHKVWREHAWDLPEDQTYLIHMLNYRVGSSGVFFNTPRSSMTSLFGLRI